MGEAADYIRESIREQLHSLGIRHGSKKLPEDWEHIEDALMSRVARSQDIAAAFTKVTRRRAPHGLWVEYGHQIIPHAIKSWAARREISARDRKAGVNQTRSFPFFRNGVKAARAAVRVLIKEGIFELLHGAGRTRAQEAARMPRIGAGDNT